MLALGRAWRAAEVLLGDDVGGVQRPAHWELDAQLLECDAAVFPVVDTCVALLPRHLVVWVYLWSRELASDADGETLWCE